MLSLIWSNENVDVENSLKAPMPGKIISIEKYGGDLFKSSYKVASSMIIESIQNLIASQGNSKESEKNKALETKVYIMNKVLLKLCNYFFDEILNDLMQLFVPGGTLIAMALFPFEPFGNID